MANSVSIVITILNEEGSLTKLLAGLILQTQKPQEVIVVDGGSTDSSLAILKSYKNKISHLNIYSVPGSRSKCRNYGVLKSKSKLIAFTDAGCVPKPDWLANLIQPFSNLETEVVSGYYAGFAENTFQKSLIPFVLVMPDKIGAKFLPATRSMAIKKSVFIKTGGFDENLYHNEDFAYATKLDKLGYQFIFAKNAVVVWYPRKNLKSASWMFLRFALGDVQAGIFRPQVKRLAIRYLVGIYLFFLALEIPVLLPLLVVIFIGYLFWAIFKNYRYVKSPMAIFWLPVIQLTCDISVLFGSLVGLMYKISTK